MDECRIQVQAASDRSALPQLLVIFLVIAQPLQGLGHTVFPTEKDLTLQFRVPISRTFELRRVDSCFHHTDHSIRGVEAFLAFLVSIVTKIYLTRLSPLVMVMAPIRCPPHAYE
jgi:hypothetical protein